jgi:tRNA-dihydrouridine synthase
MARIWLSSSPMQGITDDVFRMAHARIFGGIDEYYGPYIRLEENGEIKKSQWLDAASPMNKEIHYIPQILSNHALLILDELRRYHELGFTEANWNLGCPYPMVTLRNLGAGLLNKPQLVDDILCKIIAESPIKLSVKCRLGLENHQEIIPLMGIFNQYPLTKIMIHARTAKQMYSGYARPELILPLLGQTHHKLVYNGDIQSARQLEGLIGLFDEKVDEFMVGRGLIVSPHLAAQIHGEFLSETDLRKKWLEFHSLLLNHYSERMQDHPLFRKMISFWEYFSQSFIQDHKALKLVKKSRNLTSYINNSASIFHHYEFKQSDI